MSRKQSESREEYESGLIIYARKQVREAKTH